MAELRKLKAMFDHLGIQIRAEWLPSVVKKIADGLSRRYPTDDITIRRKLLHSIVDGIKQPHNDFKNHSFGEYPVFLHCAQLNFRSGARIELIHCSIYNLT